MLLHCLQDKISIFNNDIFGFVREKETKLTPTSESIWGYMISGMTVSIKGLYNVYIITSISY